MSMNSQCVTQAYSEVILRQLALSIAEWQHMSWSRVVVCTFSLFANYSFCIYPHLVHNSDRVALYN